MGKSNRQEETPPICWGQRVHDVEKGFAQMAEEAVKTAGALNYSMMLAACEIYSMAEKAEQGEIWGGLFPRQVVFWAGFLEGVRTQKQKQREKEQKKKPLSATDAKRQSLKILASDRTAKSL